MEKYCCSRCHNRDERYIGYRNGVPYCRLCLPFQGKQADTGFAIHKNIALHLEYPLSEKQKNVSDQVCSLLSRKKNVLIHAVTGAGKTELVYHAMEMYLKKGFHVGFATPRKDVVIDLLPRIQSAFKNASAIAVYGEHSSLLEGDIIVLTTHQLYRYKDYFDLLILDEIDAFPYKGNALLHEFFHQSIKGNYILLSATPSKEDLEEIRKDNGEVVELFERYHHAPLPLPEYLQGNILKQYSLTLSYVKKFQKENKPVFIFVPTIEEGKKLYRFLSSFLSQGAFVSSKEEERRLDIEKFKDGELRYLVTTSILERGVTVKNLQVIVFFSNHVLFDKATLVQIAGRVGRKIDARDGKVLFLGSEENQSIQDAIHEINRYNQKAHLL